MTQLLNLDRNKLAAELFFSDRTGFCPGTNGWEADEMKEYISSGPAIGRLSAIYDIRKAVRELTDECGDPEAVMPTELLSIAGLGLYHLLKKYDFTGYIDWLDALHTENLRLQTEAELAQSRLDTYIDVRTSAVLSAITKLGNLRAVLVREGDDLLLRLAEREWGRVSVRFSSASFSGCPGLPLPCYLYRIEGEHTDGGFRFALLCDTRFSQGDYLIRLLQPENWQEVIVDCRDVKAEAELYDYYSRFSLRGRAKLDIIADCYGAIVSKAKLIGDPFLNPGENELLAPAKLFLGLSLLDKAREQEDSDRARSLILEGLDDRYYISGLAKELEKVFSGRLSLLIKGASERLVVEDEKSAVTRASAFYTLFEDCAARGMLYPYLEAAAAALEQASGMYEDDLGEVAAAAGYVSKSLTPLLERRGFEGEYPCFSRKNGTLTELMTVRLSPASDRMQEGKHRDHVTLSCARTQTGRLKRLKDVSLNALDCEKETIGFSDYTELCGRDDGVAADVEHDWLSDSFTLDRSALLDALKIADHGMKSGSVPFSHRMKMVRARGFFSSLLKVLGYDLHIPAVVFAGLLALYLGTEAMGEYEIGLDYPAVLLIMLGISLAAYLLYSAVDAVRILLRFWRQK